MARRRQIDWDKTFEKIEQGDNKKAGFKEEFDNIYKPKIREDGTASVIVRFLPPPLEEDLPYVKRYNHQWQDINGWYTHNCPTSIGEPCPVCKENGRIWGEDEKTARTRGRKTSFYANILVINDPECPENNGQVFLFKYGIKIHEKIMAKVKPQDPLDQKVNIFDYDKGANFKLKIKQVKIKVGGKDISVPNYDASEFSEKTPIVNPTTGEPMTDAELDVLDNKLTPLAPIIGKDKFKSYEELAVVFTKKTGIPVPTSPDETAVQPAKSTYRKPQPEPEEEYEDETPVKPSKSSTWAEPEEDDDEDEEQAFLNSLRQ